MGIKLLSVNDKDNINVKQYICDSEDEKGNVETDFPGSKLFVIASGKEYKLGENGSWTERNGTGGGSAPTQTKTATPTTSAQEIEPDSGYLLSKVTVAAIPSQYIVPTGTKSITENGTGIDVAQYAAVDVAVPSSGGYTLIHSEEVEDSYSSTSAAELKAISLPEDWAAGKLVYVKIRDKAGPRQGYFYGTDSWFPCFSAITGSNTLGMKSAAVLGYSLSSGTNTLNINGGNNAFYGIYVLQYSRNSIKIAHGYNSSYSKTINGTYTIEVYLLDYVPGGNPFSSSEPAQNI